MTEAPTETESEKAIRWHSVYYALRDAVVGHRVAPGTKLPEDELASIYSVSRTVVRAALQSLAHDRLIRLEPNRGAFVAQPSRQEAREVFEARALIEPQVATLAASAARPDQVAKLRRHMEEEHLALRERRDSDAIMLSAQFHISIAEMANHSVFTEIVRDLVSHSSLIIALYWRRRDTTCESHAHHALVDAIEAGHATEASDIMRRHIVDLLSGLDLSLTTPEQRSLSSILKDPA